MSSVIGITVGTPFNIDPLSERVSRNDKRITNLEQGIIPDPFETDNTVAYIKNVPANALPYAEISKVGGMTYYADDVCMLMDSRVTEIKSVGANLIPNDSRSGTIDFTGFYDLNVGDILSGYVGETINISFDMRLTELNAGSNHISIYGYQQSGFSFEGDRTIFPTYEWQRFSLATTVKYWGQIVNGNKGSIAFYDNNAPQNAYSIRNIQITLGSEEKPYNPQTVNTLPIPKAVQALDGYGWGINDTCYNYIDWDKKQFVKCVDRVDMGEIYWAGFASNYAHTDRIFKPAAKTLCINHSPFESIYIDGYGALVAVFTDGSFTSADELKGTLSGAMLYYELATPEVTNISNILSADNFIGVGGDGTITAVNDYLYAVPTEITYMLKGE